MDDVNVRGPPTWYQNQQCRMVYLDHFADPCHSPLQFLVPLLWTSHTLSQTSNTLAQMINTMRSSQKTLGSIGLFWEHLNWHKLSLQCFKKAGGTFSDGKIGHLHPRSCGCGPPLGCYPEDWKVQKILDWPDCNTPTKVHRFLGVCGVIWIWVKDFSKCARPLVVLTIQNIDFVWGPRQRAPWRTWSKWCYSPMSLANRLSFWLMCYPGCQLLLYCHQLHSLTAQSRQQALSKPILVLLLGMRENPTILRLKLKSMASGAPSKHIGSYYWYQESPGRDQHELHPREC